MSRRWKTPNSAPVETLVATGEEPPCDEVDAALTDGEKEEGDGVKLAPQPGCDCEPVSK